MFTQPSGPAPCVVTNGSGAANANVTNVQIACATVSAANEWTWVSGANLPNQKGVYGTQGVAAPGNVPGAREQAATWTDTSGNFWLFGGSGYDSVGAPGYLNDLWRYNAGQWTWMSGSNMANQPGAYGTQGTAAPSNVPGVRYGALAWTDAAGDFWLVGGFGFGSTEFEGYLNDLWKFSSGEWTWVGGSNTINQLGIYGTLGQPAPGNIPGARVNALGWIDADGTVWLFGGSGFLNDLWNYSAGQWT